MSIAAHEAPVTASCCVQSCLPSLLDHGILTHVLERGGCSQIEQKVVKLGEVPFDFDRRRATVVVRDRSNPDAAPMMVCKVGADALLCSNSALCAAGCMLQLTALICSRLHVAADSLDLQRPCAGPSRCVLLHVLHLPAEPRSPRGRHTLQKHDLWPLLVSAPAPGAFLPCSVCCRKGCRHPHLPSYLPTSLQGRCHQAARTGMSLGSSL